MAIRILGSGAPKASQAKAVFTSLTRQLNQLINQDQLPQLHFYLEENETQMSIPATLITHSPASTAGSATAGHSWFRDSGFCCCGCYDYGDICIFPSNDTSHFGCPTPLGPWPPRLYHTRVESPHSESCRAFARRASRRRHES